MTKRVALAVVATLMLVLTACGMPDKLEKSVNVIPESIKAAKADVKEMEKKHKKMLGEPQYSFAAGYTTEQLRTDRFDAARVDIDTAESLYKKGITPLVENYQETNEAKLNKLVKQVNKSLGEAEVKIAEPAAWLKTVADVRQDTAGVKANAESAHRAYDQDYQSVVTQADKAKKTFAAQTAKIDEKLSPVTASHNEATAALTTLQSETDKATPNYAVIAGAADTINKTSGSSVVSDLSSQLIGLYDRETHTLIDIRVDSVVYVERTSWDDSVDFPDEHDYEYPGAPVDPKTAEYFAQFAIGTTLMSYADGSFGSNYDYQNGFKKSYWKKLGLDNKAKWNNNDDAAEWYMGEVEDTYCHKVKAIRNSKPDSSGAPKKDACTKHNQAAELAQGIYWVESDELMADAIGMDIYSKPYGDFPDQATTAATPPGMAYVGDPSTGEWQEDQNGNSFWHYYGMYAFFSNIIGGPNGYHYRSDYDAWNRGYRYSGKPFYAPDASGKPRFGASSPLTASRFPGSNFTKTGLAEATVRNSGPIARAGGPGGGGK